MMMKTNNKYLAKSSRNKSHSRLFSLRKNLRLPRQNSLEILCDRVAKSNKHFPDVFKELLTFCRTGIAAD